MLRYLVETVAMRILSEAVLPLVSSSARPRCKGARGLVPTTVATLCMLVPGIDGAQSGSGADLALRQFEHNVAAYLALRQRVSTVVEEPSVTSDATTLLRTVNQLRDRIRTARLHVRQGDIFNDDVARTFRTRIQQALRERGISSTELLSSLREDTSTTARRGMTVNGAFDWAASEQTPPVILAALPALPDALEYKLVRRALVLVDVEAGLVVDILPDALPAD
jgi:hypothetical protein